MEELSFVPSAVSDPRWALHMWNNKCREKGFQFFQIAAIVSEERDAAHTLNLCWTCHTERRLKQGEEDVAACRALVERKVFQGKFRAPFGTEQLLRRMWERFTIKKSVDQIGPGRCGHCEAKWNGRQVATRDGVRGGA